VTGIVPSLRGVRGEAGRFYNHAAPVAMSSLGKVFQNRVDVLLVGALLTATAAGVYNVVLVLIAIAWIPSSRSTNCCRRSPRICTPTIGSKRSTRCTRR